ncbi:MAG: tetraspanin family protein [Crocinitomicaceae bacterium]|nr:tetraspanin family protein [Crocinitomicaceae bacterium]
MSNLEVFLKKLSVPFIFFLLSLSIFYIGVDTEQDKYFYIGASLVLSASVLTALFSLGILNKKILIAFSILGSLGALLSIYYIGEGVDNTYVEQKRYLKCKSQSILNLNDLRMIQSELYKKKLRECRSKYTSKGDSILNLELNKITYTDNWSELINFLNTGTVTSVDAFGTVPDRPIDNIGNVLIYGYDEKGNEFPIDNNMTEQEAWLLTKALDTNYRHLFLYQKQDKFNEFASKFNSTNKDLLNFRRDSSDVSFLKTRFTENKSNILKREKQGYFAFNSDSLKFIPYNGAKTKWEFELDKKKNELKVIGTIPYGDFWKGKTKEELVLTLKTKATNRDQEEVVLSWEDE